ncbi:hypothetical protein E1K68_09935 [Pseudomonas sp. B2021]|nr:hypothetical protein [Pseudomonas sp. B2021]
MTWLIIFPNSDGLTMLPVGASLLAKNVNDNAQMLNERGDLTFFASKLAPTVEPERKNPPKRVFLQRC